MRVTNGIPLGSFTLLPVDTVNCIATLKAKFDNSTDTGHAGLITLDKPFDQFVNASSIIAIVPRIGTLPLVD
jgi:hypothetical protein